MNRLHFIGFDIETGSDTPEYQLQPYRLSKGQCEITAFAAVREDGSCIDKGLRPGIDQLHKTLTTIAEDPLAVAIGSNTVFDVAWMIAAGLEEVVRKINWMDFQTIWHGIANTTNPSGWGLKQAVRKFLPEHAGYEDEVHGDFNVVNDTLLEYNYKDSWFTAQLGRIMWDLIEPRPAMLVQVISQCIPAFAGAWLDGVGMSRTALYKWQKFCDEEMDFALTGLLEHGFDAATIRSHAKLKDKLNALGFPIESTDKSVLSLYAGNPIIDQVRRFKRATGSKSRYIQNAITCMDYIGQETVHPQPRMWGTYTGRCTYSSKLKTKKIITKGKKAGQLANKLVQVGVALHQWPKKREGKIARSCIVPPKGFLLAEFDFSNQESRVLADRTQDPTLLSVFNDGKDFHSIMGAKAAHLDYDEFIQWYKTGDKEAERIRQMGKVSNLSLAYRTGSVTFQTMARTDYDIVLTIDEAVMLVRLFKQTYPGVVNFWSEAIALAKQKGYAETMGGRRVYLDNWDRNNGGYASEQTAINFPIQGTGADMKFLGIALAEEYFYPRGARYNLDLHDALFVNIPDDSRAFDTARRIQKVLNNLPYREVFGWTPTVPLPVDCKIGSSWGDLKDINS